MRLGRVERATLGELVALTRPVHRPLYGQTPMLLPYISGAGALQRPWQACWVRPRIVPVRQLPCVSGEGLHARSANVAWVRPNERSFTHVTCTPTGVVQ
jgi:hypothetical protein